jgi:hypothetical protein
MTVQSVSYGTSVTNIVDQIRASLPGDAGAEIAALLVDGANDARHENAAARACEERHLQRLEDEQVDSLLRSADATRTAGWEQGIGLMVSGAVTIAGSVELAAAIGDGEVAQQKASAWSAGLGASGKSFEGVTTILAANETHAAKEADAAATKAGNEIKAGERRLGDLDGARREADDLARTALQSASDWLHTEAAANQATLYLRG